MQCCICLIMECQHNATNPTRSSGERYLDGASAVHAPGVTPDSGRNGVGGTATSAGNAPIVNRACSVTQPTIDTITVLHALWCSHGQVALH